MPYRSGPISAGCRHCAKVTSRACMRCAHPVCEACEQTHDETVPHKDYSG